MTGTDQIKNNDWDVLLKHVLFAYRTSENASTKYTPFYLMWSHVEVFNPVCG
jgi:hypothetical protein